MATFTPVNELERLLARAAVDPAGRPAFFRALPEHDLFVISEGHIPERAGLITFNEETPLRLRQVERNGSWCFPLFTSVERISAVVPETVGFVAIKGRKLLQLLREKNVILNPGCDYGKLLTPQEISGILDGSHFGPEDRPRFDAGQKMLLGVPAEFPHHITEPLKRYFATRREVKQAYLAEAWIRDGEGEESHSLIGIVVSGDWEKIEQEAGLVVRDVVQQGELVALMQIRRGDASFIPTYLQRQVKPFYRRRPFGLF